MKDILKNHTLKITVITAVSVIFFVVGATNYFVTRVGGIEASDTLLKAELKVVEEQSLRNKERIMALEEQQIQANLDRIKIITKLENIEVTLLEVKQTLKEHGAATN